MSEQSLTPIQTTILTDRPGRTVAKVLTTDGILLVKAPFEERELVANERLRAIGLPVPKIVARSGEYLMMEWVDGDPLSSKSPPSAQLQAGRMLRQVHELGGEPPYKGNERFVDWMRGWLHHNLLWWEPGPAVEGKIWAWFEELTPLLETRGGDLMLMDGRPEHFIVRDGEVVAMIDVAEVCPGDGAMDLAVMAVSDPDLLPGIRAGYGPTEPTLIPLYLLMRRLSHAEWCLTYGYPAVASKILRLVQLDLP